MQEPQAMTPLEDLKRDAVRHYEELATKYNNWNSLIPKAIEAYDPSVKKLGWIKASKWPAKLTGERIGKTNYKRDVLVTILKNGTADWRNREYEDEKVEFILLESAEDLSAPASPVEEKPEREGKPIPIINKIVRILNEKLEAHGDKDNGIRIFGRTEAAYNIERLFYELTESKPSPVIEIGEQAAQTKAFMLWLDFEPYVFRAGPNDFQHIQSGDLATFESIYDNFLRSSASHPAPAPIVGEREEEIMEEHNRLCAEGDKCIENIEALMPAAKNEFAALSAPKEQVLPEEVRQWIEDYAANERKGKDLHYGGYVAACHALYHKMQEDGDVSTIFRLAHLLNAAKIEALHIAQALASARALITKIKRWDAYQEPADECDKWLNDNPETK